MVGQLTTLFKINKHLGYLTLIKRGRYIQIMSCLML